MVVVVAGRDRDRLRGRRERFTQPQMVILPFLYYLLYDVVVFLGLVKGMEREECFLVGCFGKVSRWEGEREYIWLQESLILMIETEQPAGGVRTLRMSI